LSESFFYDTTPRELSPLSLHDALPICAAPPARRARAGRFRRTAPTSRARAAPVSAGRSCRRSFVLASGSGTLPQHFGGELGIGLDRKSTRLNSSHRTTSYAVFCLKIKR